MNLIARISSGFANLRSFASPAKGCPNSGIFIERWNYAQYKTQLDFGAYLDSDGILHPAITDYQGENRYV